MSDLLIFPILLAAAVVLMVCMLVSDHPLPKRPQRPYGVGDLYFPSVKLVPSTDGTFAFDVVSPDTPGAFALLIQPATPRDEESTAPTVTSLSRSWSMGFTIDSFDEDLARTVFGMEPKE